MKRFTVWERRTLESVAKPDRRTDQSDFILGDPPPEARPTPFASPIILNRVVITISVYQNGPHGLSDA